MEEKNDGSGVHECTLKPLQKLVLQGTLLNYSFNFAYSLVAALLVEMVGISSDHASLILSIAFAASAILQVFFGRLVDRGHYRAQPFIAFAGNAIGVVSLFSHSILFVAVGVTMILISAATLQMLGTHVLEGLSSDENRRKMATTSYMFGNAGFAISSCLAFMFIHEWRTTLLILDIITTGGYCLILGFAMLRAAPQKTDRRSFSKYPTKKTVSPRLILILAGSLGLYISIGVPFFALQLLYKIMGLDALRDSTVVLGVNALIVILGGAFFPMSSLRPFTRIVIASALLCAGITLQPLTSNLVECALFTILWSIGEILIVGDISYAFFHEFTSDSSGLASGLKVTVFRLALIICPLIVWRFRPTTPLQYFTLFGLPAVLGGGLLLGAIKLQNKVGV